MKELTQKERTRGPNLAENASEHMWGFQIVCLHTRARYHKSEIWKWNKCTLSCIFDIWSLKLETIANEYRRSHRSPSLPLCCAHTTLPLPLSIPICLCASPFGLSACLPAWWTWRACRQHVPHLSVPVCVLSMCTCVCACVCVYPCHKHMRQFNNNKLGWEKTRQQRDRMTKQNAK